MPAIELPEFKTPDIKLPEGFSVPTSLKLPEGFSMPDRLKLPEGLGRPDIDAGRVLRGLRPRPRRRSRLPLIAGLAVAFLAGMALGMYAAASTPSGRRLADGVTSFRERVRGARSSRIAVMDDTIEDMAEPDDRARERTDHSPATAESHESFAV